MTVAEVLATTSPETEISIIYIWDNFWIKQKEDGIVEDDEDEIEDEDVDDEYSYEGTAGDFMETMKGYLWLLDEEVEQVAPNRYEIRRDRIE